MRTLNLIADQLWFEGRLLESRDVSERAVQVAERTLRPDHPTVALSLRFLAATLADLGDLGRSLELKKRALLIAERNFGATHPVLAEFFHSLGVAELDYGDYSSARLHFQQALSIYKARYGEWHELVATGYSVMAEADARLGDYRQCAAGTISSRGHLLAVGGPNHPYVAIALTELATVYLEQGLPARRFHCWNALSRSARRPSDLNIVTSHGRSSTWRQPSWRWVGRLARRSSRRGPFASRKGSMRPTRRNTQRSWRSMPGCSRIAATVLPLGITTRGRWRFGPRCLAPHIPCMPRHSRGWLSPWPPSETAAPPCVWHAMVEATGRDHLRLMLRSLPERQALNYAAARPRGLDLILSLSGSLPEAVPFALDGLIRSRALVLDEIAARQSGGRVASEGTDLRGALSSAQQRLANLMVRGPGQMSPAQYKAVMEAARRESELAEQALARGSAEFRAERSRAQIGLQEVTAALPADGALVSFARYQRTVFDAGPAPLRTIPVVLRVGAAA